MRCPKCHYLSFEPEPRCRNCGFDLGADEPGADLSLKVDEPDGDALADLSLRDAEPPKRARSGLPPMRRRPRGAAAARATAPADLHDFDPLPARSERPLVVEPEPDHDAPPVAEAEYVRQLDADLEELRESAAPNEAAVADAPVRVDDDDASDAALADLRPIRLVPPAIEPTLVAPAARAESRPPVAPPSDLAPAAVAPAASAAPAAPIVPAAGTAQPPGPAPSPSGRPSPLMSRRIPSSAPSTSELPLFVRGLPADEDRADAPMVAVASQPRAPLAVQLRTPDPPRPRSARRPGQFDKDLLEDLRRIEKIERGDAAARSRAGAEARPFAAAGVFARIQSLLVDAALLAVIAGVIVWLTVRFSGLTMSQIRVVPMLPLGGFLLLVMFGYLFLFTAAGGQTVGKMLIGLRVVPDDAPDTRATGQQAALRSLVALPSVLLVGLGFVPALFGGGRALHDRASGTRVVGA